MAKTKRRFNSLLLAVMLLPSAAPARVGETETALTKEFGEPTTRAMQNVMVKGKLIPSFPKLTYLHEGWKITCILVDEKCERTTYGRDGVWPEEEYARVLGENAQGGAWSDDPKGGKLRTVKRSWIRSDGATAEWRKNIGLTVITPAFVEAEKAVKDKARNNLRILPKD